MKSCCRFPPFLQVILGISSSPRPGFALLSTCSSSQLPCASGGRASWDRLCRAAARIVCVVFTLFGLSWISCFTLRQPQMLPFLSQLIPPDVESLPASAPPALSLLFLLLSFFVLPRYASIHKILSSGQGLLLVFRLCSVRTVASIDVFLIHPWERDVLLCPPTSTFLSPFCFFLYC